VRRRNCAQRWFISRCRLAQYASSAASSYRSGSSASVAALSERCCCCCCCCSPPRGSPYRVSLSPRACGAISERRVSRDQSCWERGCVHRICTALGAEPRIWAPAGGKSAIWVSQPLLQRGLRTARGALEAAEDPVLAWGRPVPETTLTTAHATDELRYSAYSRGLASQWVAATHAL
jgi:hypothetical protein